MQTEGDFSSVETWVGPCALMEILQSFWYMKNVLSKFGLYRTPRMFWGNKKKQKIHVITRQLIPRVSLMKVHNSMGISSQMRMFRIPVS